MNRNPRSLLLAIRILTPLAIAFWTVSSFFLLRQFQQGQLDRQILEERQRAEVQRELSQAQLGLSLLPAFANRNATEAAHALRLLAAVAPALAESIAPVVAEQAKATNNAALFDLATKVQNESAARVKLESFSSHLSNADAYARVGRHEQAAREQFAAFDVLPRSAAAAVDRTQIETARTEYSKGNYEQASRRLERALRPVSGPEH